MKKHAKQLHLCKTMSCITEKEEQWIYWLKKFHTEPQRNPEHVE